MKMSEKLERLELERKHTSEATELKTLTNAEASYLAGLIDGDGYIALTNSYTPIIRIGIAHTNITNLCNQYGSHWIQNLREDSRHKKAMYYWGWNITLIEHYLHKLIPHFRIKKDQAKLLLEALTYCHKWKTKKEKERLKEIKKQLEELHHKAYPLPEKYRKMPQK